MKLFDVYPLNDITITKAKGSYVWDDKGSNTLICMAAMQLSLSAIHTRIR